MSWKNKLFPNRTPVAAEPVAAEEWDSLRDGPRRYADTGDDKWDFMHPDVLEAYAENEKTLLPPKGPSHLMLPDGKRLEGPYADFGVYEGAGNALAIRKRWLHEQGLATFAYDHLELPPSEYERWKPMILREAGKVAIESEVTAETAMRIAIFSDRLFHEKLLSLGILKEVADAFRVECISERKSYTYGGSKLNLRREIHPLMVVNPSKLQAGLAMLGEEDYKKQLCCCEMSLVTN